MLLIFDKGKMVFAIKQENIALPGSLRHSRGKKCNTVKLFVSIVFFSVLISCPVATEAQPVSETKMHSMLTNNVARVLRYWPVNSDFVITNGTEFFNRPLYCDNSAFRIDAGDKPEFSLYVPGRGGNFRPGIETSTGIKWLNDADQIVTRYRAGSMIYEVHDRLLDSGTLTLAILPLSDAKGFVIRAELDGTAAPVKLIWAFGGANGMRGKRGGDIGCESEPVSQFFQLHPSECKGNEFSINSNGFVLHSKVATIAGIFPKGSELQIADAMKWNSASDLFASTNLDASCPIIAGRMDLPEQKPVYFALKNSEENSAVVSADDLPGIFSAAEEHRHKIAEQVTVETPDAFINAAVPALNIAADAIWDGQQQSFMHGAVAWRVRLAGWRGPYAGDALGWHELTAAHFTGFAREQNTDPLPATFPPADEDSNLARHETALHSNGDLTHSHYDMNLVLVDAFFRHLLWTGDTNYAAEMWPVIARHLAWERRLFRREFGPDKLPLYEGYAAIWASDDLSYNGGGAAHASAYNYFENKMAAQVAKMIGKDPAPYDHEADLILRGMNQYLWMDDGNEGHFAEYKDYLGQQLIHPDPGLWTYYTVIDSEAATPGQARLMSAWLDAHSARIPVHGPNVPDEGLFTLPETDWLPYEWSLNNVVMAEAAHTSLAYWESGSPDTAFRLFKGELLGSMFLGLCPGNLGAITTWDAARGEAQRDFADAIGINSRALVEGLFGVKPDALAGVLKVTPGFPVNWNFAKISHPDFNYEFHGDDGFATYMIEPKFSKPMRLVLRIRVGGPVRRVTVNGVSHSWNLLSQNIGVTEVEIACDPAARWDIRVEWNGSWPFIEPQPEVTGSKRTVVPGFNWTSPFPSSAKFEPVNLAPFFNDAVTQIFRNEYRVPRSPFCSLATPKQGIGGWCEPNASFDVDDSGLRKLARQSGGKFVLPDGVPLATPAEASARNIVFASQWHNYPDQVSVPLAGKSSHAFLLMAGSSNPMQSRMVNGEVVVTYADGMSTTLPLRNPDNWWPIDQDYFIDDFAFRLDAPLPPRVDLKTGRIRILKPDTFKGKGGKVPGGAATVLELPLDPNKELKSLTVRAMANEVVIGLMAVTLERE